MPRSKRICKHCGKRETAKRRLSRRGYHYDCGEAVVRQTISDPANGTLGDWAERIVAGARRARERP